MAYKQGFLYFSVLTLILMFYGFMPVVASAEDNLENTVPPVIACDKAKTEAADVNDDGVVNQGDYDFVQGNIGCDVSEGVPSCFKSDVNHDGVVNTSDYVAIRGQMGCRVETQIQCDADRAKKADINDDNIVNTEDYDFVQNHIGCAVNSGDAACDKSDVNGDGAVNTSDFVFIRSQIGCRINVDAAPVVTNNDDDTTHQSNSGGSAAETLPTPPVPDLVLGAGTFNWDLLTAAERAELIAPFREQLLLLLRQLQILIQGQN